MPLTALPKLRDLLTEPGKASLLPPEAIPAMRGELARLDSILLACLIASAKEQAGQSEVGDRLLDVKEAASKLGISEHAIYRSAAAYPFTIRLGKKRLRFSSQGIDRYIRVRSGRY